MTLIAQAQAKEKRRGGTCTIELLYKRTSEKGFPFTADEIRNALARPWKGPDALTSQAISEALFAEGVDIPGPTVARHRSGRCRCPR